MTSQTSHRPALRRESTLAVVLAHGQMDIGAETPHTKSRARCRSLTCSTSAQQRVTQDHDCCSRHPFPNKTACDSAHMRSCRAMASSQAHCVIVSLCHSIDSHATSDVCQASALFRNAMTALRNTHCRFEFPRLAASPHAFLAWRSAFPGSNLALWPGDKSPPLALGLPGESYL